MVWVGYMTDFQDYEWYNELADENLKEETLKQKAIYEKSWGNASQSVMNFCAWLKRSFGNFHELDYEVLVKLQDYWWKVNDHEFKEFNSLLKVDPELFTHDIERTKTYKDYENKLNDELE
ncbi:hypothetical protein Tco_0297967 [Tanacetum coccineum]